MLKLIVILVVAAVAFWIWQTRRPEIMELVDKAKGGASPDADDPEDTGSAKLVGHARVDRSQNGPIAATATKLSPLDVPMIQARFEKLGVLEHLNEHQADTLRHTILEHCREGREELWWYPLVEFAKFLDYQKGEMPAIIMDATALQTVQVRKYLFAMDYRLRRSGLALDDITTDDGKELEPDFVLTDGAYKVNYKVRDRAFRFPVNVTDGALDIQGLVRTVNGLCERKKARGRFLLLPPTEPIWCVVYALFTTAEQFQRSQWAQLPLPAALTEDDVERVSQEQHSALPEKPPESEPPDDT